MIMKLIEEGKIEKALIEVENMEMRANGVLLETSRYKSELKTRLSKSRELLTSSIQSNNFIEDSFNTFKNIIEEINIKS